ncbi:LysR family transcriptional regulator [Microlunatus ginsengisoli]|uniref:LysR family transcriptional regulator n=1 Tax=Microlunatus ginsengisoli TaxID=363863 RepID=A0ABP6ZDP4_9ACTN
MDLDLRKLRYFVAVAECGSFRTAAQHLHVAQPALSRQVRALETDLGVSLLTRTGRGVVVTGEGRRVLQEARSLLQSSADLVRRARQAGLPGRTFTVGFRPGIPVTALARRFQQSHPRVALDLVVTSARDQADLLISGRVDAGLVRSPCDADELECLPLFVEPRVVVVATNHPIAALPRISVHELRWLGLLQSVTDVPELTGLPAESGTVRLNRTGNGTFDQRAVERFERVAAGQGALVVPQSVAALYRRPELATVAVDGAGPSEVLIALRKGNNDPLLGDFSRVAVTELQAAHDRNRSCEASL